MLRTLGAGECLNLGDGGVKLDGGHYIGVVENILGHPGQGGIYAIVARLLFMCFTARCYRGWLAAGSVALRTPCVAG